VDERLEVVEFSRGTPVDRVKMPHRGMLGRCRLIGKYARTGRPQSAAPECKDSSLAGGSDGDRSRGCIMPPEALVIQPDPGAATTRYSGCRPSKADRTKRAEIAVAVGSGMSLRDAAATFDVSHETVRRYTLASRVERGGSY